MSNKETKLLDRLELLAKKNPDFEEAILKAFPELEKDEEPFIYVNQFFCRDSVESSVYALRTREALGNEHTLFIQNLATNTYWNNGFGLTKERFSKGLLNTYLTISEFKLLLKSAGVSFKDISLIPFTIRLRFTAMLLKNNER